MMPSHPEGHDYNGDSVELADAKEMVEQADTFVTAISRHYFPLTPSSS
jgi:hypothetical protein